MIVEIIGILAAITGTIRLVPQIIKSYVTKSVDDLSIWWQILGAATAILWLIYGILIDDIIITIGMIIVAICFLILVYQKKIYSKT